MNQSDSVSLEPTTAAGSGGVERGEGMSYGGYTDLHGEILSATVSKVCKKLGIAIDGGANTKQKAVIIREISVSTTRVWVGICESSTVTVAWRMSYCVHVVG